MEYGYELRPPVADADWAAYHEIRRTVLFERRGQGASYDAHHPDDRRPGNHPFLLVRHGIPLGVIRVDLEDDLAIFRRVAIREEEQRKGHGRQLIALAERFALAQGCARIRSFVDPDAVRFYERCGFRREGSGDEGSGATTPMGKRIGTG